MRELLSDKSVIFFDVGYTIDYPASGDWVFTKLFYESAADKINRCPAEQIREARAAGLDYLEKNHLIRNEAEEADKFYHYYSIISEVLQLKLTEDEIVEIARDRTYNMDNYVIYPDARRVIQTLSITPLPHRPFGHLWHNTHTLLSGRVASSSADNGLPHR